MMLTISFTTIIIIALVAFIIGMIFGVSLARPKGSEIETKKPRRILMEVSDEEYDRLTKPKMDIENIPVRPKFDLPKDFKFNERFLNEKEKPEIPKTKFTRDLNIDDFLNDEKKKRKGK